MFANIRPQKCLRILYQKLQNSAKRISTKAGIQSVRDIGILAHIDAGKTTTTERMLYYSGKINSMGEVHYGNTVTDYMDQERERGITITAASVSFMWNDYQFNLIDTPGHIDFTMEVEQSLGVLDGVVIVLDGSAGVEAQTVTVWRQTNDYRLPRIIYANKMDRKDSSLDLCIHTLREYLDVEPLCLQLPVRKDNNLVGIMDIITQEIVTWSMGSRGRKYIKKKLTESQDGPLWEEAVAARRKLVDSLSGIDDKLANIIISLESLDNIPSSEIKEAVRRSNLSLKAFPLLCGSAYKNIGVQLLMDAVIDYLPSPLDAKHFYSCFEDNLCAKVFKIQHHDQKGVLTFLRLFEGHIDAHKKVYNITRKQTDQLGAIYVAYADELQPVTTVTKGNIAVVSGLKSAWSGDLITTTQTVSQHAKKRLAQQLSEHKGGADAILPPAISLKVAESSTPSGIVDSVFALGSNVPDPVFMCSIEPPSLTYQLTLENALAELQREDPSIRVIYNEETAQTILAGMGELHLDVLKHKIINDYKLDASFGDLTISYKELLIGTCKEKYILTRYIAGQKQYVHVELSVKPVDGLKRDEPFRIDNHPDSASNLANVHPKFMQAVRRGVESSQFNGPKAGCPIVNADITLHWLETGKGTSDTAVTTATAQGLKSAYKKAGTVLLEPVMKLQITTLMTDTSPILGDLVRRHSFDLRINKIGKNTVIECVTPLARLLGYSNDLRQLTSGMASFNMEFHSNREVAAELETEILLKIRGF